MKSLNKLPLMSDAFINSIITPLKDKLFFKVVETENLIENFGELCIKENGKVWWKENKFCFFLGKVCYLLFIVKVLFLIALRNVKIINMSLIHE